MFSIVVRATGDRAIQTSRDEMYPARINKGLKMIEVPGATAAKDLLAL